MKSDRWHSLLILVLVMLVKLAPAEDSESVMLKVGDLAPEFEMVGSDGQTYQLSDYRDKQAVVLAWYPRAFTGGCTIECKSFRNDGDKLRQFKVAYFAASCDPIAKNNKFAEALNVDFPILSDPDAVVAKRYGNYDAKRKAALRWTMIIGKGGVILEIDKSVKVTTHAVDVAARLKELGVEMQ